MDLSTFDINDFNDQTVPLTYFRRNAGEVFERGKPLAIISDLLASPNSKQGILSTAGVWKDRTDLSKIKRQHSR